MSRCARLHSVLQPHRRLRGHHAPDKVRTVNLPDFSSTPTAALLPQPTSVGKSGGLGQRGRQVGTRGQV